MIKHNIHQPAISVLLPVYNAERYVHEAVESVLKQTFEDFELIILDDGSTDTSLEILKEFAVKDERVRIISRENKGLVPTLNELAAEASGQYLARMDADDICLPERFEKQVAFLENHQGHVLVGCWIEAINEKGQPILISKRPTDHDEIDKAHLAGKSSISHPTALIVREAFNKTRGYDNDFIHAEDMDLWLRLAEIGKIANISDVLVKYRLHDGSISEKAHSIQMKNTKRAVLTAFERRGILGKLDIDGRQWRPDKSTSSQYAFAIKYGWQSWGHGYRNTWWTYACKALRLRPFAISSWRLLIFGFLKRPQERRF